MAIAKYWNDVSSCERGPKTPQLLNSFSTSLSDVLVQLTTQVNHAAWRTKELRTKRNSRATAFRIRSPISPWQTQLLRPLSVTSPPQPTKRKVEPMCQSYWSQLANDIPSKWSRNPVSDLKQAHHSSAWLVFMFSSWLYGNNDQTKKKVNFTKVRGTKITAVKKALIPSGIPTLETQHHTSQERDIKITNQIWVTQMSLAGDNGDIRCFSIFCCSNERSILEGSHWHPQPPLSPLSASAVFWSKLFCGFLVAGCFWSSCMMVKSISMQRPLLKSSADWNVSVSWENNIWWRRDATTQESVQIKRIVKRKMSLENGLVEDKSAIFWFTATAISISFQTRGIQGTSGRLCAFDCRWDQQNLSRSGIFWMKLVMIQCIYVWFCSCLYYRAKCIQEPCGLKPSGSPRWKPFAVGLSASAE